MTTIMTAAGMAVSAFAVAAAGMAFSMMAAGMPFLMVMVTICSCRDQFAF